MFQTLSKQVENESSWTLYKEGVLFFSSVHSFISGYWTWRSVSDRALGLNSLFFVGVTCPSCRLFILLFVLLNIHVFNIVTAIYSTMSSILSSLYSSFYLPMTKYCIVNFEPRLLNFCTVSSFKSNLLHTFFLIPLVLLCVRFIILHHFLVFCG